LYVIVMGEPKQRSVTIKNLAPPPGSQVYVLGDSKPLPWAQRREGVQFTMPSRLPGRYAYVLKMSNSS
jgi:hypothetical protein